MNEIIRCKCTRVNVPWRRFCGVCGASLQPSCGGCGFVNAKHDRFCGGCGVAVFAAKQPQQEPSTMPIDILTDVLPS